MFKLSVNLVNRCINRPLIVQSMGKKKKKNLLKPLEGEEAKYFNNYLVKGIHEPEYLSLLKPPIPFYYLLNLKFMSVEYVSLEEYIRYIQRFLSGLGFKLNDYWALPHRSFTYQALKHQEAVVDSTFDIRLYQRVIQLKDIRAASLPIIIQLLEANKPPGLTYLIKEHEESDTKERHVVNTSLLELKKELDTIYTELEELGVTNVRKPELLE